MGGVLSQDGGLTAEQLASFRGDKGDKGLKGDTGSVGATGDKGDRGSKGDKGDKGDVGDKGDEGDKGEMGPRGLQGSQGIQGERGLQGLQGLTGDKGDSITGATGLQGIQGLKGDKGDKGDIGLTGLKGDKGDKGDIGIQGLKGDKGDKGDIGLTGLKGDKGDKGDIGLTGPKGDKGLTGDRGLQGESVTGAVGPQGPVGPTGASVTGDVNVASIQLGQTIYKLTKDGFLTVKDITTDKISGGTGTFKSLSTEITPTTFGPVKGGAGTFTSVDAGTGVIKGGAGTFTGIISGDYDYDQFSEVGATGTVYTPATGATGGWTVSTQGTNWDTVIRGVGRQGFAHNMELNDQPASGSTAQINVPPGMKTAFIHHLAWDSGRYFDIFGVINNTATEIFIKRVTNYSESTTQQNGILSGGSIAVVPRVDRFVWLRIKGVRGRIHYMGTGWSKQIVGSDSGFVHGDNVLFSGRTMGKFGNENGGVELQGGGPNGEAGHIIFLNKDNSRKGHIGWDDAGYVDLNAGPLTKGYKTNKEFVAKGYITSGQLRLVGTTGAAGEPLAEPAKLCIGDTCITEANLKEVLRLRPDYIKRGDNNILIRDSTNPDYMLSTATGLRVGNPVARNWRLD